MENKKCIVTGDRLSGRLHIGHYFGSKNLQIQQKKNY